jgi:hypothetical protein
VAPIVVDPDVLSGAGESVGDVGDELAAAVGTLAYWLPEGAMAGYDAAGRTFGQTYQQAAQALLDAAGEGVNAGRKIRFGVQMSATNYSRADASSTIGSGATPLAAPAPPAGFDAPVVSSPLGEGVAEPALWSMVSMLVGDLWPSGDPKQLRSAAGAWQTFSSTLSGIGGRLSGPSSVIGGQQIPEGEAMTNALSQLGRGLNDIGGESGKLATQVSEFASDVESTQNAIRDLLARISPSGILNGLKSLVTGDAMEELREVADDINTVLDNLKRQVDSRKQAMEQGLQIIDAGIQVLQVKARQEFTEYLGDDVGNAAATAFDTGTNFGEGILKGGAGAVDNLEALNPLRFAYDPDGAAQTWGGLLQTAFHASNAGVIVDPQNFADTWEQIGKGTIHADEWSTDRPGLGAGMVAFDFGSALIPGVGPIRGGTRAAELAEDVAAAGRAVEGRVPHLPGEVAGDLGSVSSRANDVADNVGNIKDDIPTAQAESGSSGPGIPQSVVDADVSSSAHTGAESTQQPLRDSPTSSGAEPKSLPDDPAGAPEPHPGPPHSTDPKATPAPVGMEVGPSETAPRDSLGPDSSPAPNGTYTDPPSGTSTADSNGSGDVPARSSAAGADSPTAASGGQGQVESPAEGPSTSVLTDGHAGGVADQLGHTQPAQESSVTSHGDSSGEHNGREPGDSARETNVREGERPNHPPHTGLHEPPANHGVPGERLPDLTAIDREYRLPDGSIDPDRIQDWADEVSQAYPGITPEGVEGVYNYTTDSYQGMNPYLRDPDPLSPDQQSALDADSIRTMTPEQRLAWEQQIGRTDDGIASLPPYRESPDDLTSTTWRGMQAPDSLLEQLTVGHVFSDPAYFSSTVDRSIAELFAGGDASATTPTLISVTGHDGVDVSPLSRYADESEILFPRGTQFQVISREFRPDGVLQIDLRQVGP